MKLNIHTPSGLMPISPEVTKQTIIEALGYFPVNQAMYSDIEPTDDSTFYIIDKDKIVICKVDADGISDGGILWKGTNCIWFWRCLV